MKNKRGDRKINIHLSKKWLYTFIAIGIILIATIGIYAAVDKEKAWHNSNNILVTINGYDITLQQAIDNDYLKGTNGLSSSTLSEIPNPGHSGDKIWVSVDGSEMTLQDIVSTLGGLCGTSSNSYINSIDVGQLASEIEVSSGTSLQDAIDSGEFCGTWQENPPTLAWSDIINLGQTSGWERFEAVATDSQDNIIASGTQWVPGVWDKIAWYTVKYDSDGNMIWNKGNIRGLSSYVRGVAVDSQDNIIVTGNYHNDIGTNDYITIKYDPDGNVTWTKTFDSGGEDGANAVATDSQNNIIVTGTVRPSGVMYPYDYYTIKYDPDGNVTWTKRFSFFGHRNLAYSVAVDSQDNIIVTGETMRYEGAGYDYGTIKYDSDGNVTWTKTYNSGGYNTDSAREVTTDSQDNIIVIGNTNPGVTNTIKYDPDGNVIWDIDGPGYDGIATDSYDNIIILSRYFSTSWVFYTAKYDSNGNLMWTKIEDTGTNEWPWGVAVDSQDDVIVTGGTGSGSQPPNYYTVKYSLNRFYS